MAVLSVPRRLRGAALLLFASVPLAALEVILVSRAPWWRLPLRGMAVWSIAVFVLALPLVLWLSYGRKWAIGLTGLFGLLWVAMTFWMAVRLRAPALGFLTVGLLGYFLLLLHWVRTEASRSFFDPQMAWYQSLPKPIPGLQVQLLLSEKRAIEMRAGRLDEEGAFLYVPRDRHPMSSPLPALRARQEVEVELSHRGRKVRCLSRPMRTLEGNWGCGVQFRGMGPDQRKELGDFIEALRGEGYET